MSLSKGTFIVSITLLSVLFHCKNFEYFVLLFSLILHAGHSGFHKFQDNGGSSAASTAKGSNCFSEVACFMFSKSMLVSS